MLFAVEEATIFGIAAAVSTLIGAALGILGFRASRKAAAEAAVKDTHDELLAARAESERLSAELHKLRMEKDAEP